MEISDLTDLGFIGPYPNGEYSLSDKKCARKNGWCMIMCVYPPVEKEPWQASYNSQRGLWCDDKKFFDSGWIEFSTRSELESLIKKSKELKTNN